MAGPSDAIDVVASTSEPSFAVDDSASIIAWNSAAERLLGVDESKAFGVSCLELIDGKDVFGNRFCGESCALTAMACRREVNSDLPSPTDVGEARRGRCLLNG